MMYFDVAAVDQPHPNALQALLCEGVIGGGRHHEAVQVLDNNHREQHVADALRGRRDLRHDAVEFAGQERRDQRLEIHCDDVAFGVHALAQFARQLGFETGQSTARVDYAERRVGALIPKGQLVCPRRQHWKEYGTGERSQYIAHRRQPVGLTHFASAGSTGKLMYLVRILV
jgi:hypothetical protein